MNRTDFDSLYNECGIGKYTNLSVGQLWDGYVKRNELLTNYIDTYYSDQVSPVILIGEAPPEYQDSGEYRYMLNPEFQDFDDGRSYIRKIYDGIVGGQVPKSKKVALKELGAHGFVLVDIFLFSIDYSVAGVRTDPWYKEHVIKFWKGELDHVCQLANHAQKRIDIINAKYGFLLKKMGEIAIPKLSDEPDYRHINWLEKRDKTKYQTILESEKPRLSKYKLVVANESNFPSAGLIQELLTE